MNSGMQAKNKKLGNLLATMSKNAFDNKPKKEETTRGRGNSQRRRNKKIAR